MVDKILIIIQNLYINCLSQNNIFILLSLKKNIFKIDSILILVIKKTL